MADSDDADWFDKDEDEMAQNVENKLKLENKEKCLTEHITTKSETDDYFMRKMLEASESRRGARGENSKDARFQTTWLRQVANKDPLNAFLCVMTGDHDFFDAQISVGDSQERILLYIRILIIILDLRLPAYHQEILQSAVDSEELWECLYVVATKLYSKRYASLWKNADSAEKVVTDIKHLIELLTSQQGLCADEAVSIMRRMLKLITGSDSPQVAELGSTKELASLLEAVLQQYEDDEDNEGENIYDKELYPSLEELMEDQPNQEDDPTPAVNKVQSYVSKQKYLLRSDFMISLKTYVRKIKVTGSLKSLPNASKLYENVRIVMNHDFLYVGRDRMLFIDFLGAQRNQKKHSEARKALTGEIRRIKHGSLLCLSTSKDFENLIYAAVVHTDDESIKQNYIAIKIMQQYNIGNVYNKDFLMFETPAFFEPYNNVYNYLKMCNIQTFPMQQYIVGGESSIRSPAYLQEDSVYYYGNSKFQPLNAHISSLPKDLPLNESQKTAFLQALKQEFCLIQGPPGTGKTHLSIQIMRTLIQNAKKPIVLITYTNESLDKFLLKLSAYTQNIVRFGGQLKVPEIAEFNVRNQEEDIFINARLKELYYETNCECKEKFQELQECQRDFDGSDESYNRVLEGQQEVRDALEKFQDLRAMFHYYVAKEQQVIAMTTTCAAKLNFLFRLLKSSVVIFEEAAEILESHVLACLTPYTEHVIMIGDHMQLKPYTMSNQHNHDNEMKVSLFERLIKSNVQPAVLQTQYRMRPEIADLVVGTIYEQIRNAEIVQEYPSVRAMSRNLYFLNHNHDEAKTEQESSLYNDYEIGEIMELGQHLVVKGKYNPSDVVILSPYAKQIALIKNKLSNSVHLSGVKAMTVDSFQGLEANIVLLSLVRSNSQGRIGFLDEKNRICVALSRAKIGMYMIGNLEMLAERNATWNTVWEKLRAKQAVGPEFPYCDANDVV